MGIKFVEHMLTFCDDLEAQAADLVEPHDQAEVSAFADRLCGLEGLTLDEIRERLAGADIPGDFRHLRLHNLTKDMPWGGITSLYQSPLTLDELLVFISCVIDRNDVTLHDGPGVWTETVALTVKDPGVLELGLSFRPLH